MTPIDLPITAVFVFMLVGLMLFAFFLLILWLAFRFICWPLWLFIRSILGLL